MEKVAEPLVCLTVLTPGMTERLFKALTADNHAVCFVDATTEPQVRYGAVVLHRVMYDASMGEEEGARRRLELVRQLSDSCVLVDPIERVLPFADRGKLCSMLAQLAPAVQQPRWLVVQEGQDAAAAAQDAGLRLPIICKPLVACGPPRSHQLAVGLEYAALRGFPAPMLLQEYVAHGGRIFKAYCVGEHVHCEERDSLPDLMSSACERVSQDCVGDGEPIPHLVRFSTQGKMPRACDFGPVAMGSSRATDETSPNTASTSVGVSACGRSCHDETVAWEARRREAMTLAATVARSFEVGLLGVDIIVRNSQEGTGHIESIQSHEHQSPRHSLTSLLGKEHCDNAQGNSPSQMVVVDLNYFPNTCLKLGDGGAALAALAMQRHAAYSMASC